MSYHFVPISLIYLDYHEKVNKGKKWADIGRLLGYGGIPGLSTQLRNSYIRVILPYEHYQHGVRNSASHASFKRRNTQSPPPESRPSVGPASPKLSPLSTSSSPLSEPPDDADLNGTGDLTSGSPKPRKSTLTNGSSKSVNHGDLQ